MNKEQKRRQEELKDAIKGAAMELLADGICLIAPNPTVHIEWRKKFERTIAKRIEPLFKRAQ